MAALTAPLFALLAFTKVDAEPPESAEQQPAPVGLEFAQSSEPAAVAEPSSQPEVEGSAGPDRSQEAIETFADIDAFNAAVEATMVHDDDLSNDLSKATNGSNSGTETPSSPAQGPSSEPAPAQGPGLATTKPTFDSLYPRIWLGVGGGANFRGDINVIGYALSGAYFFLPELGGGLSFQHHMQFADRGIVFPGPRNIISLLAEAHWLALPRRRLTPKTTLGLGPVFFSQGYRALGRWTASVDMIAKLGPVYLSLGVAVGAMFPLRKYEQQFVSCGLSRRNCSFTIQPRIGVGFGSRR